MYTYIHIHMYSNMHKYRVRLGDSLSGSPQGEPFSHSTSSSFSPSLARAYSSGFRGSGLRV